VNLLDFRFDKYSSTGNDGIIQKIFEILDIEKGFFVEFGADDGIRGSNCRNLYEQEWSGVFIEANSIKYAKLVKNYENNDRIECIRALIGIDNNLFDHVVNDFVDEDIDFCSIDIDGLDVMVFETFEKNLPKVVCIEGGQMLPPFDDRVSENIAKNNIQQSLIVMCKVFEAKGYRLLCSYQDSFFIRKEFYEKFDVSNNIFDLYLDGLKAIPRRIPWICEILKENGLSNDTLTMILVNCGYTFYGYEKRKEWAIDNKKLIETGIEYIRKNNEYTN